MSDYIRKQDILAECDKAWNAADENTTVGVAIINIIDKLTDFIESLPTADVQPVKRGEWEKKSSVGVFRCSLCQHIFMLGTDEIDEYHFCPHCGARMDGAANG